jgi:hypothetical protein
MVYLFVSLQSQLDILKTRKSHLSCYKSTGKLPTDDGKLDCMEMHTLGQDEVLGTIPRCQNPEPIKAHRKDSQDFFRHAYSAVCVILFQLYKQLGLPLGTLASLRPLVSLQLHLFACF